MATGTDFCTDALRYAGIVGQGIDAAGEDIATALTLLNDMLAEWSSRQWLVYHMVDSSVVCNGALNYTIGPAGSIVAAVRPERIWAAYVRLLTLTAPSLQTDFPLELINSRQDYTRITLKQMQSFPQALFYDAAYPLGLLYPWPLPSAQFELHVVTQALLSQVTDLAATIVVPPEYNGAIKWNLARRLRAAYRYPADREVNSMAANGINVVSSNNFAVATLDMPSELVGGGRYNFFSDTVMR